MSRNPMCRPGVARPRSRAAAVGVGVLLALALVSCSGNSGANDTGGNGGVGASSNQPVAGGGLHLGTGTVGGITVTGAGLRKSGAGIAVLATVTSDHPDRLTRIASNYTAPATLAPPLAVTPGVPTTIDASTVVLQPSGPIDDGATVAVSFTFASAGIVQVYGTYRA